MARLSALFLAIVLAAIVVFNFAAQAEAAGKWCHKSGYDGIRCAQAKAAKRQLWAKCAKGQGIKLIVSKETCTKRPGKCAYTVVQTVIGNQATWKKYDACEHAQAIYKKTFTRNNANLGDAVCKFDRAC